MLEVPTALSDKYAYVNPDAQRLEQLEKLILSRLEGGQGECFLELGVGDGQTPGLSPADLEHSVATVEQLARKLGVSLIHLRDRTITGSSSSIHSRKEILPDVRTVGDAPLNPLSPNTVTAAHSPQTVSLSKSADRKRRKQQSGCQSSPNQPNEFDANSGAPSAPNTESISSSTPTAVVREYLVRKELASDDFVDVRVAVVGNVDAGKSTLLGVLTHGELDNGRGQARLRLLRHKHEAETGRTSSVSNDILGFNSSGVVVNKPVHGQLDWSSICKASTKVITFIDLAGHERYLKTTIFGMTGHAPDYAMFMVGANAGVIGMAKEHLGLALALAVPVFVVVTKIDMCPPNVLQETMNLLCRILKSPGCRKIPLLISSKDDVVCSATNFTSERMCPVFSVSNVTGENLDLLKMFLNLLTPRSNPRLDAPAHFQVDDIFSVPGVGNVVSGTCLCGIIRLNDTLLLGPDPMGQFAPVPIKSIHRKRMPVTYVRGGQTASFALRRLRRNQLRKGIVLVSPELRPRACLEFMAEILILHHPTTIWVGYQAMVHAGPIRQTATILALSGCDRLRTGDKDLVRFRFIKYPEYLYSGLRLIFREGKTKAVGTVKETFSLAEVAQPNAKNRMLHKTHLYTKTATPAQPVRSPADATDGQPEAGMDSALAETSNPFISDPYRPAYSKQRKHYRPRKDAPAHKSISTGTSSGPQEPPPAAS